MHRCGHINKAASTARHPGKVRRSAEGVLPAEARSAVRKPSADVFSRKLPAVQQLARGRPAEAHRSLHGRV